MKIIEIKDLRNHSELQSENNLRIKLIGNITDSDVEYFKNIYAEEVDASETSDKTNDVELKSFKGIKHMVLSNDCTTLNDFDFSFCPVLETIKLSKNLKHIGEQAFSYSNRLTKIDIDEENANFSAVDGILYDKNRKTLIRCPEGVSDTFTVPEGTESIANFAFYGCKALEHICLPNSLKEVGESAFQECEGLRSIDLTGDITTINKNAFFGCISLETITLPKSLLEIQKDAFFGCSKLKGIQFPKNIENIDNAFNNCQQLESFSIEGGEGIHFFSENGIIYNRQKKEVEIVPTNLSKCTVAKGIESVGKKAFERTGITFITLSSEVKEIKDMAFRGCYGLNEIELPQAIESLGARAFDSCTNLTKITSYATTPPQAQDSTFCFLPLDDCVIYVPETSIDKYREARGWNAFNNIKAIAK